ncbi:Os1348 family NHLP clan protein [Candidatus Poribacteria bacterium]
MKEIRSEDKLLADFTESLTGQANTTVEVSSENEELLSLFRAVQTIHSVIQPEQLPEGFASRMSYAVQERFQERMSAEKIQRIIGMAVTIEDFRKSLFQDIVAACRGIGLSLTPKEIAALRNLKEDAVKDFANSLDERITKFFPINLP